MTERRLGLFISLGLISLLTLMPVAAGAAQQRAEPALLNLAWWWKQSQTQEINVGGNTIVVGTSSPYCPGAGNGLGAAPGACAEGKFPVEIIGGEYDQPDKLSALGFDLSYLTPGSTVTKFEVTLLEAEAGCYDGNEDGQCTPGNPDSPEDHVEQTDPVNIEGKKVQACLLPDIFGDSEAGKYSEVPRYQCSATDPLAERKEIKAVDKGDVDGFDHVWTFDLTPFAQQWAQKFTVSTSIMLIGAKPEQTDQQDSWSVVFAGPKVEKGIQTELVYEPAEIEGFDPGGTTTVDPDTGITTTTDGTTDFGTGTTDFGTGTDPGTGAAGTAPGTAGSPSAAPGAEGLASDTEPAGTPGYVWLALLAGLIGFAMVRQVVIESATGIRPDGVLAKIHALNADRRGVTTDTATASTGGIGAAFAGIGRTITGPFKKLPFFRKG